MGAQAFQALGKCSIGQAEQDGVGTMGLALFQLAASWVCVRQSV